MRGPVYPDVTKRFQLILHHFDHAGTRLCWFHLHGKPRKWFVSDDTAGQNSRSKAKTSCFRPPM